MIEASYGTNCDRKDTVSEEPLKIQKTSPKTLGIIAVVVVAIVLAVGSMGIVAGTGFFGYRTVLYGDGQLYVLNMSDTAIWVEVDERERVEVPPENAQIIDIIGGESQVVAYTESGEVHGRYTIAIDHSHAFLKLSDAQCLAAVDLNPFYKGGSAQDIEIVELLDENARVWIPNSRNVVWPRKDFPKQLTAGDGPGIWIELVGCPLLEDEKFLDAYLAVRLEERMKKALGKDEPR